MLIISFNFSSKNGKYKINNDLKTINLFVLFLFIMNNKTIILNLKKSFKLKINIIQ